MSKKLPDFNKMTHEQIADFWDTHEVTDYLDQLEVVKEPYVDKRPMKQISIRFDEKTIAKIKKTASKKGIAYQTLIRMWVNEKLNKEAS
ncbi:MAG: hypothetical protein C4562_07285 [Actinobacteria bacterium]|nr:MAG: hypothetical protein C4562_07285 [Actinomycetota bacterium]